jgi:hypothetical protein
MDLGLMPKGEIEVSMMGLNISESEDLESGSVSIGYYHPVYQVSDKMGISVGGSYEVVPASDEDVEFGFMALYGALGYSLSDQLSAWGSLGISVPTTEDFKDVDAETGMHMGLGVSYSINDQIGASLGYVLNSTEYDMSVDGMSASVDMTFSKIILSLGYKL